MLSTNLNSAKKLTVCHILPERRGWVNMIMLSVRQGGIKYHFLQSLVWLDLGMNPGPPDHWRTLYSLAQCPGDNNCRIELMVLLLLLLQLLLLPLIIIIILIIINNNNNNFMDISSEISHEKTWIYLRKGNLKRETESLLSKQDETQQNGRCRLCGDRDKTINHIIRWDTIRWGRWSTANCERNLN